MRWMATLPKEMNQVVPKGLSSLISMMTMKVYDFYDTIH